MVVRISGLKYGWFWWSCDPFMAGISGSSGSQSRCDGWVMVWAADLPAAVALPSAALPPSVMCRVHMTHLAHICLHTCILLGMKYFKVNHFFY